MIGARRVISESTFQRIHRLTVVAIEAEMYARVFADSAEYIKQTWAFRGRQKMRYLGLEDKPGPWRFTDYHAANDAAQEAVADETFKRFEDQFGSHAVNGSVDPADPDPADSGPQSFDARQAPNLTRH